MLKVWRSSRISAAVLLTVISTLLVFTGCTKEPKWAAVNKKLVAEHNLTERTRTDIPNTKVTSNLEEGVVTKLSSLPEVEIAPGCKAHMYWNGGNLICWMTLEPGAEIPKETLPSDLVLVVWKGSVQQLINGQMVDMKNVDAELPIDGTHGKRPSRDYVFIQQGSENNLKAGPEGAEILEAFWPVRLDYLQKAGAANLPSSVPKGNYPVKASVQPNTVYNYFDIQFTELTPGANSRLITLPGMQLSFIRMDPGSVFGHHNHPEHQVMIALRGWIDEIILDGVTRMQNGDCLNLPGGMVHGGTNGPMGCDALDVFWPARADYDQHMQDRLAGYNHIIPENAKVELVIDGATTQPGLTFGEGPSWLNGKLYFSSMHFGQDWSGDPKRSKLVEMDPDGTYRYIIEGKMQTNGTIPMASGNLAVCDMFGHRVIEVTTKGKVVRTIADKIDGVRFDGPNDIVSDAKGGFYVTDPQFIPDERKQPGRSVYYVKPNGEVIRVIEPNEFAMPNGVILSPDGKTLYVNNTYDNETWWNVDSDKDNFIWAYDVNDDGTLANGRKFGALYLSPEVLDREGRTTSADGLTIDTEGNLYVATIMGIQILNAKGEFVGIINFPVMPVSCCFGGDDMKTLYAVCYDKVYKIQTNVAGVTFPLK